MAAPTEWEVFDERLPLLGGIYGKARVRMLAFGLHDGGLCVVSPGAGLDEARFTDLERWGRPRFLLAPNHFHNAGLAPWKARYPEATVVAHPRARARLGRRLPGIPVEGLERLEAALPDGVRLFGPPMAKQGELWCSFRIGEGTAWNVTDGILNETHLPSGPLGLLVRLLGFRTGLMTNPFFKRVFLEDKAAYKAWVRAELARDPPTVFIPAHGAVARGPDLVERLLAVTEAA